MPFTGPANSPSPITARSVLPILAATLAGFAISATLATGIAQATPTSAWWHLGFTSAPTLLPHTGEAQIVVTATNRGYGEVNAKAEPIVLTDELPAGVKPVRTSELVEGASCKIDGQAVTCTYGSRNVKPYRLASTLTEPLVIVVEMEDPNPDEPLENVVSISGGEIPSPPPLRKPLTLQKVEGEKTPFGVETYELTPETEDGLPDTQAGAHPFQLTTLLDLNQRLEPTDNPEIPGAGHLKGEPGGAWPWAPRPPRNLHFKLPPGLIGDPDAVPRCSDEQFQEVPNKGINRCPADTAVGVANAVVDVDVGGGFKSLTGLPVFNLQSSPGEPARFGFIVETAPIILKTALPSGGGYGVEVSVEDISQVVSVLASEVTLWGVPGDPRHDPSRGWFGCAEAGSSERCLTEPTPKAFLDLPTSCSQAPTTSVSGESWAAGNEQPAEQLTGNTEYQFPTPLTGCGALEFDPSLSVEPEQHSASTPTGLNVGVEMPQPGLLAPEGDVEAALKQTTVRLPPGLLLNPAAANALEDCTAKEFDFLDQFDHPFGEEGVPEEQQTGNETFPSPFSLQAPDCPDAAKVGTVNIATPLLPHELTGSVYLAAQNTNPFFSPLAVYLLAEDPAEGIRVKLAGTVEPEAGTGQLTSTFANTPQLPFTALHLHFFGGERASLSTPPTCAQATTTSEFIPWSGEAPAHPESSFQNTSGVGGAPCPSAPLPFSPSFGAGPSSPRAGAFSSDLVDIGRPDGDQAISGLSVTLPPGFAGVLASVTPCPEPAAGQEWSCGEASRIGEAREYSGLGSEPVQLTGQAYLTSGYDGAPFGLLVRTLAAAGPFNLGYVNVRSRINVNPNTAQVTVTTDPGPRGEGVPTMLDGVPVQLKALEVAVNRPDFTFNPTSCNQFEVTGTLNGSEGAAFGVSDPFKAEGCAALPFRPTLEAATQGQASKVNGASLTVRVTSQGLGVGNIAKTKLTLPAALPSRLTTIQKACVDSVFESTPADPGSACDEGSVIGEGIAHTPVLKAPLRGPAYLVSHGGAAFPDVEFVLKGEGILLVLDGKTDIKNGITTSEFNSVPDAPVETFEAILPVGPHSALGAYASASNPYDLCAANLVMPTIITGQNGAVIEQTTKIATTGCGAVKSSKAKKLTLAQQLAKALAKCRSTYKHSASKRAACERQAHAKYTAMAMAACRKSDKHSAKKRKSCEAQARKAYAARARRRKG